MGYFVVIMLNGVNLKAILLLGQVHISILVTNIGILRMHARVSVQGRIQGWNRQLLGKAIIIQKDNGQLW
jgi:hypothetical protein